MIIYDHTFVVVEANTIVNNTNNDIILNILIYNTITIANIIILLLLFINIIFYWI